MENTSFDIIDAVEADINGNWILWPQEPDESLIESFSKFGQIVPVIAVRENNRVKIVAGYRRALAAQKLGMALKVVFIEANPVQRAMIYMQENFGRTIDDSMRLAALRYFSPLIDQKSIKDEVAPLLGIRPKSRDMKLWTAWLELPEDYDNLLCSGSIPLAAATLLRTFSPNDLSVLKQFFENLSWSRSNAVNFLTWLYESAKLRGKTLAEIVAEENLTPRRLDENPKDAAARIAAHARRIRYPHLSDLETQFSTISTGISSGTGWRISSSGNFENGDSEILFRIRSRSDLEKALSSLNDLSASPEWEKLWNLGREE